MGETAKRITNALRNARKERLKRLLAARAEIVFKGHRPGADLVGLAEELRRIDEVLARFKVKRKLKQIPYVEPKDDEYLNLKGGVDILRPFRRKHRSLH